MLAALLLSWLLAAGVARWVHPGSGDTVQSAASGTGTCRRRASRQLTRRLLHWKQRDLRAYSPLLCFSAIAQASRAVADALALNDAVDLQCAPFFNRCVHSWLSCSFAAMSNKPRRKLSLILLARASLVFAALPPRGWTTAGEVFMTAATAIRHARLTQPLATYLEAGDASC